MTTNGNQRYFSLSNFNLDAFELFYKLYNYLKSNIDVINGLAINCIGVTSH